MIDSRALFRIRRSCEGYCAHGEDVVAAVIDVRGVITASQKHFGDLNTLSVTESAY